MRKIELLDFLNFEDSVTAKVVAERFDVSLGAIYNTLTALNIQGLVRKVRGDDGVLIFSITDKGKERLDYLSEKEDDNDFDENLKVKMNVGGKTMARKRLLSGEFFCPSCDEEFTLDKVVEGSEEAFCPDCDEPLEPIEETMKGEEED